MIYDPDKECEIMVNRMKEFCEMRGITQYRLAKDMNMSTSGMSSIFRRKVVPSIYTLMQICNGLEVRLQDLFLEGNDEESEADMFPLDKLHANDLFSNTSPNERQWLYRFRYLPQQDQEKVQEYMMEPSRKRWREEMEVEEEKME